VLVLAALTAALAAIGSSSGAHHPAHDHASGRARKPAGQPRPRTPSGAASAAGGEHGGPGAEVGRLVALGKPIYCAGRHGDEVALTFDDGPGPYTRLMLRKLRKHGLHATFFVVGRNIPLVPGAVRSEREIGAVGDHTFTHPLLTSLSAREAEAQIVRTQKALERASGGPVFLFRPPYGAHDATVDRIARGHGLLEILWTVDSEDSLGADYAQIARNVTAGLKPGAILLMHENHGQTIRAMLAIFAALQRRRLRAVSVPQLLADDPPSPAQVRAGWAGCGLTGAIRLAGG
jgi:peptidoglycan/xylan/chitin deacetylase (PgdA/CDA1 family)